MTALTRVSVEVEIAADALERATAGFDDVRRLANEPDPDLTRLALALEHLTKALVEFHSRSQTTCPQLYTH